MKFASLLAIGNAAVLATIVAGAGLAAAQTPRPLDHHGIGGGDWRLTLIFKHAKSVWGAQIEQSGYGRLRGTVEPPDSGCAARVTGKVHGHMIKMTWHAQAPCASEAIVLKGKVARGRMSGTFRDKKLGSGTFRASRDS